jgi:hypothetical protein
MVAITTAVNLLPKDFATKNRTTHRAPCGSGYFLKQSSVKNVSFKGLSILTNNWWRAASIKILYASKSFYLSLANTNNRPNALSVKQMQRSLMARKCLI